MYIIQFSFHIYLYSIIYFVLVKFGVIRITGIVSYKHSVPVLLSGRNANFDNDFSIPIKCHWVQTLSVILYNKELFAIQIWCNSEYIDLRLRFWVFQVRCRKRAIERGLPYFIPTFLHILNQHIKLYTPVYLVCS